MAMNVNTNKAAMTTQRYLTGATNAQQNSMERLTSGFKFNKDEVEAPGLHISNTFTYKKRGLDRPEAITIEVISIAHYQGVQKE